MSLFQTEEVACPSCGEKVNFDVVYSVNADRRPDLREAVLDGTFQEATCANCDKSFRLAPELSYLDVARRQWILVQPFEQLEQCLLIAAERLSSRDYLVGDRFSAADLTLAALLRPIMVVPFFRDHPRLQRLFGWRATQLRNHRREPQLHYEAVLHDTRRSRGWALGAVSWLPYCGAAAERSQRRPPPPSARPVKLARAAANHSLFSVIPARP